MTRSRLLAILVAVLILGLVGLGIRWIWGRPPAPAAVRTSVVTAMSLRQEVHASGTVVAETTQQVQAFSPGRVSKVAVHVGDTVKKGQLLIQMDPTLANAQVAQAQAGVEVARAARDAAQSNLAAVQTAGTASAGTQTNANVNQAKAAVAQAESTLKQANAALQAAEAQRAMLTYNANIDGTVLEVNCAEGNPAPMQGPLLVLGDLSHMQVQLQLNELDGGRVAGGQQVEVRSKVLGDRIVKGTVAQVAPAAVDQTGLSGYPAGATTGNPGAIVPVKISLKETPPALKSGYTVDVDILTAEKTGVLAIPQEAVFPENNGNYVFKVQSGRIQKVQVKPGIADDVNQEITAGLQAGDQVVINPAAGYYDGMPVVAEGSGAG